MLPFPPKTITTTQMEGGAEEQGAVHPKHAALIRRLSTTATTTSSSSSSSELSFFLEVFSCKKESISAALLLPPPTDPSAIRSHVRLLSSSLDELDALLSSHSHLLPPYDLRSSLHSLSLLRSSLHSLLPRKTFSFRRSNPTPQAPKAASFADNPRPVLPKDAESISIAPLRDSPGFRGAKGSTFVKDFRSSHGKDGEFTLEDLDSCQVYLKGSVRALFVRRIVNCRVFVGVVMGSVLVDEANECVFAAAAHQIRIHQARATDFYLRVRSRPIVEDCGGVRFGPYAVQYDGLEEELEAAGLHDETGHWANVDDFKWLRAVQSPNWRVLAEEEREAAMDISGMEETCG